MHGLLTKLLRKRGIESIEELDAEEVKTFQEWQAVLSKEELTIKDIKDFCQTQVDMIENKWTDLNLEQTKKAELIPYHTVYKTLLRAIDSPKAIREALEKNLIQLIQ